MIYNDVRKETGKIMINQRIGKLKISG